jgi:hypothetical protein
MQLSNCKTIEQIGNYYPNQSLLGTKLAAPAIAADILVNKCKRY